MSLKVCPAAKRKACRNHVDQPRGAAAFVIRRYRHLRTWYLSPMNFGDGGVSGLGNSPSKDRLRQQIGRMAGLRSPFGAGVSAISRFSVL
jgi:hypothetical protein